MTEYRRPVSNIIQVKKCDTRNKYGTVLYGTPFMFERPHLKIIFAWIEHRYLSPFRDHLVPDSERDEDEAAKREASHEIPHRCVGNSAPDRKHHDEDGQIFQVSGPISVVSPLH